MLSLINGLLIQVLNDTLLDSPFRIYEAVKKPFYHLSLHLSYPLFFTARHPFIPNIGPHFGGNSPTSNGYGKP